VADVPRRRRRFDDPLVVTFTPEGAYGTMTCSWEEEPRKVQVTEDAARKFAEGWKAEFAVKGEW
jgi:hypothetical protein